MYRFWDSIFSPLLSLTESRNILEIGSDRGHNTIQLVRYCALKGGLLHVIDPALKYDWQSLDKEYASTLCFYHGLSIPVLKEFDKPLDCAFIDGDHNWYSVYNELHLLRELAVRRSEMFPLTFLHDVNWPYARRDLYYDPTNIPPEYRQPYAQQGIIRGEQDLQSLLGHGLNPHLHHALKEGGPKNGVLTAVEDFIREDSSDLAFIKVPVLFGLGIIWSRDAPYSSTVETFVNSMLPSNEKQREILSLAENERLSELTRATVAQRQGAALRKDNRSLQRKIAKLEETLRAQREEQLRVSSELLQAQVALRKDAEFLRGALVEHSCELEALKSNFLMPFKQYAKKKAYLVFDMLRTLPKLQFQRPFKTLPVRLMRQLRDYGSIRNSGLFNSKWYRSQLKKADLTAEGESISDYILHYLQMGAAAGLNPNALFDSRCYLKAYPDVDRAEVNPFVHYLRRGISEGRHGGRFFDLQSYTDVNSFSETTSLLEAREQALDSLGIDLSAVANVPSEMMPPVQWAYSISEEELLCRVRAYNNQKSSRDARVVVFTANVGGYDCPILPERIVDSWDYVIFSDSPVPGEHIFEVRPLPDGDFCPRKMARFIKTHPEDLFADTYDYCIWIDASILVRGEHLEKSLALCEQDKVLVMGNPHPHRSCVQEELDACIKRCKDDEQVMRRQVSQYFTEGLPRYFGMFETGILIRKLHHEQTRQFNELWWHEINHGSLRDQLSVTYALWRVGLTLHYLPNMKDIRIHGGNDYCLYPHRERADASTPGYYAPSFFGGSNILPSSNSQSSVRAVVTQRELPVDIIICVHNALDDVQRCLQSVLLHIQPGQKVIVIDDGSDEETRKFLDNLSCGRNEQIVLQRHGQARGYTHSANVGLRLSDAPFRILLNSDTIVSSRWAEKMYARVLTNPQVGIVGPLSNAASWQSVPLTSNPVTGRLAVNSLPAGIDVADINYWCERSLTSLGPVFVPLINGFCYGISAKVLESVGYLDEEAFPRGYGEEDDLSLRAGAAGFQLAIAIDTYVYHAKSKSFGGETRKKLAQKGLEALKRKHGEKRIKHAVQTTRYHPTLCALRAEFSRKFGTGNISATVIESKQRIAQQRFPAPELPQVDRA